MHFYETHYGADELGPRPIANADNFFKISISRQAREPQFFRMQLYGYDWVRSYIISLVSQVAVYW